MEDFVRIPWLRWFAVSAAAVSAFLNVATVASAFQSDKVERKAVKRTAVATAVQAKAQAKKSEPETEGLDPGKPAQGPEGILDSPATAQQAAPKKDTPTVEPLTKLHLQDGSIIRGELAAKSIEIKTEFGTLTVPVNRILELRPGLKHKPEFSGRIDALVEQLASTDKTKRAQATSRLIAQGVPILNILKSKLTKTTGKQSEALKQVVNEILTIQEEAEDDGITSGKVRLIVDDVIVTPTFSIVGDIQTQNFSIKSKFGELNVTLADIRLASRRTRTVPDPIRKSVSVPAMAFFQTTPHSTKIRVKKGDRIEIKASGSVNWTNWSMTSSPQGIANRGSWQGFNSGMLVARIGSSGNRYQRIGSGQSFVAKSNGVLYLGIAMRDSYATNGGYTWTGQYKAKIVVTPAGNK